MDIVTKSYRSPTELQVELGSRLRALRIDRGLSQKDLASKAGLGRRAIVDLENGAGSSVATLVKALHAMGAADVIGKIAPQATVSPIAVFHGNKERRRIGRPRRKEGEAR
jgi:transcriptional regulator with XRE-family HTH domain